MTDEQGETVVPTTVRLQPDDASVRRLEHELAVFKILTGREQDESSSPPTTTTTTSTAHQSAARISSTSRAAVAAAPAAAAPATAASAPPEHDHDIARARGGARSGGTTSPNWSGSGKMSGGAPSNTARSRFRAAGTAAAAAAANNGSTNTVSATADSPKRRSSLPDVVTTPSSSSDDAADASGGATDGVKAKVDDDVSLLTKDDDDQSYSSWISNKTWGAVSVIGQSLNYLRGEADVIEEEDEDAASKDSEPFVPSPDRDRALLQSMERRMSRRSSRASLESLDFLEDDPSTMTYSRRIALSLMKKKKWYNPYLGETEVKDKFAKEEDHVGEEFVTGRENGEEPDIVFTPANEDGVEAAPESAPPEAAAAQGTSHNSGIKEMDRELEEAEAKAAALKAKHSLPVPSLEKAWAYFEHVTLPRHIVKPKVDSDGEPLPKKNCVVRTYRKFFKGGSKQLEKAEPGENYLQSQLYSPIFTPLNQMGDFGLGIGLYFATLRAIMILTFVAGLINIPNFIYFSGDDYSDGQDGVDDLLKGSAICTREVWVPCPMVDGTALAGCPMDDFDKAEERLANVTLDDGTTLVYALKNDCDGATLEQGLVNYATLFFILLGMMVMSWYQRKKEIEFDEDEQTAQDYSIIISNPPGDATDPYEWKDFFKKKFNARVTVITIGVDNDLLVQSLVGRRETLKKLELLLPGESLDVLNLARIGAEIEAERKFFGWLFHLLMPIPIGVPELVAKLTVLNAKIQGLAQRQYPSKQVFVTFETEADQRAVLSSMSVGPISAWKNDTSKVDQNHLFRGEKVLHVMEADEPSTVRWQDLNIKVKDRCKQLAMTFFVTLCAIALIAFIVKLCRDKDVLFSAIAIAVFNSIFPEFAKILTKLGESHASEGSKQTSLYIKIAAFRWVNTAIVMTIITPFTSTISNGKEHLISAVYTIFFAEIVTTNAVQLLDIGGFFKRHILGPRAKTQEAMNICFQGLQWELAERYTNMTKILFLAVWYSSIFPGAFFLCSFAMLINFFADRFSLMRTWERAPQLGTQIAKISRKYFFTTAIIAMGIISAYSWSGFPFDNLCKVDDDDATIDSRYFLPQDVTTGDEKETFTIQVDPNQNTYKYCDQNMLTLGDFPPLSKFQPKDAEWMTDDQEQLTDIYGWTAVTLLEAVCIFFAFGLVKWFLDLFRSTYEPTGEDQEINFSEVPSICAYVPQVQSTIFPYPLLAANIDYIDEEMFDWQDPDKPFSYYDLTKDAEELLSGISLFKDGSKNVFSKIRHWQPALEEYEEKSE